MYHDKQLFAQRSPACDPPRASQHPSAQLPTSAQMATFNPTTMMSIMQNLMTKNQRLQAESGKRPRAEKDEEEEGKPPIKLHIPKG